MEPVPPLIDRALRIGVLLASNDTSEFAKQFPDDGQKFRALLEPLAPGWRFEVVPVKDDVYPAQCRDYDGYVITGSPASVNGGEPWVEHLLTFIRALHAERVPTVGICFGHQAIALALGGRVELNPNGWQLGTANTTVLAGGAAWMVPATSSIRLFAAHSEQVTTLPAGAQPLGRADGCQYAAYRIGDHFFATEYHPEMSLEFMRALNDHLEPKLGAAIAGRARIQLSVRTEGETFGRWMIEFWRRGARSP